MSECKEMLQKIAEDFNCKVWVCEKISKRVSFIKDLKAGVERFEAPKVIVEDDRYVVFGQVDEICPKLIDAAWKVIDCVRHSAKNTETPTEG